MKDTLEQAFRKHAKLLVGVMVHQTGNLQDAQEIVQEVFISYEKHLDNLPDDVDVKAWLFRVAFNKSIDGFRKIKRWVKFLGESFDAPLPTENAFEISDEVSQLLKILNAEERMFVILKFIEECSYDEISKFMNIPVGTVKASVSRSMEKMRQYEK